jgi:hypothetical protein
MQKMTEVRFTNCTTCGKYFAPATEPEPGFCSPACRQSYIQCCNCGKYFTAGADVIKKGEKQAAYYCSKECSIVYKYQKEIRHQYKSRMFCF